MEEFRYAYKDLVGEHEGNSYLGRPRRRCEHAIKLDLEEVSCDAWS